MCSCLTIFSRPRRSPYRVDTKKRSMEMGLQGKKIGVLLESDYYEREILYYQHRFPEEGIELHFLTRLWGQPSLTFTGHEFKIPFEVNESFEHMDDATLKSFSAII